MMNAAFRLVIPRKGDFTCSPSQGQVARVAAVTAMIEPEPPEEEREVILAALSASAPGEGEWAAAALLEGVEGGESDP
jgi:hypothetical protein